jgi:predicted RNA-binding Zn-ribbon protein involved in translation (DUF1610 family)
MIKFEDQPMTRATCDNCGTSEVMNGHIFGTRVAGLVPAKVQIDGKTITMEICPICEARLLYTCQRCGKTREPDGSHAVLFPAKIEVEGTVVTIMLCSECKQKFLSMDF